MKNPTRAEIERLLLELEELGVIERRGFRDGQIVWRLTREELERHCVELDQRGFDALNAFPEAFASLADERRDAAVSAPPIGASAPGDLSAAKWSALKGVIATAPTRRLR